MADNIQEKIENKILDYIVLGSDGRLLAVKPEGLKTGVDLIVKRKGEYETKKEDKSKDKIVRAQIFGSRKHKNKEDVYLFVRDKKENIDILKLSKGKSFYLILVDFNFVKQDIDEKVRIIKLDDKKEFLLNKKDIPQFFLDLV